MIVRILQIVVPFVWLGLVAGLSFLEAPLKFTAPGITLELGLGIGRLVFFWLNKIELALAAVFFVSLFLAMPKSGLVKASAAALLVILLLQTLWLLPALDERAVAVISGTSAPGSSAHIVYIVLEVVKIILLPVIGGTVAKRYVQA